MNASTTFIVIWTISIVVGSVGSFLCHLDIPMAARFDALINHDLIYILLIGWLIASIVILLLYINSISKRK